MYHTMQSACYFYPRPPRGGRLITHRCTHTTTLNFYPRPPRGGRPQRLRRAPQLRRISIHALREEGDRLSAEWIQEDTKFLSTPSARRATDVIFLTLTYDDISIHALREEGDNSI